MKIYTVFVFEVILAGSLGRTIDHAETRIIGGHNTTIEQHPYQVALEYRNFFVCGGSLIKPNVVVTAAHCVDRSTNATDYEIRAGSTIRGKGGEIGKIKKIFKHPKFSISTADYDVAVLILNAPFKLSDKIGTIDLRAANNDVPPGTLSTVTGWGLTSVNSSFAAVILQEVQVPKVNFEDCKKAYYGKITDRMTCYGFKEGGKGSCNGDSGGPLTVEGKLTGIVSWGQKCALPDYPGVNTKIANKEIHDYIVSNSEIN